MRQGLLLRLHSSMKSILSITYIENHRICKIGYFKHVQPYVNFMWTIISSFKSGYVCLGTNWFCRHKPFQETSCILGISSLKVTLTGVCKPFKSSIYIPKLQLQVLTYVHNYTHATTICTTNTLYICTYICNLNT